MADITEPSVTLEITGAELSIINALTPPREVAEPGAARVRSAALLRMSTIDPLLNVKELSVA